MTFPPEKPVLPAARRLTIPGAAVLALLVAYMPAALGQVTPPPRERELPPAAILSDPRISGSEASLSGESDISVLVQAGEETTLSSQMAGKVLKVSAGLGQAVELGATLIEFDCTEQKAQVEAAEAEFRGLRETHLTKLRLQALGAAGELEVTVAAAAADKAKSQLNLRESQLAYCSVKAPFAGRVARLRVKAAESVQLGQQLVELVNTSTLKTQMFVPSSYVRWLRVDSAFSIRFPEAGRTFRARVSKLNARIEGVSQQLEVEGRFEGPVQNLLPGMVGTAVFPGRPRN